jgi:hypothetical protein
MRRESIIFLVMTLGIVVLTFLQLEQVDFIYGLGQIACYFVFMCTGLYAFYKLFKDKRQVSFLEKVKPLILGITLTGFFFLFSFLVETDGGKKRIIIGGVDHELSFIHFQLFADNTFKFLNSGPFGGYIYRGAYSLNHDTLVLKHDSLRYLYPSLTLVLKNDTSRKYFEPIDSVRITDRLFIQEDNRGGKF